MKAKRTIIHGIRKEKNVNEGHLQMSKAHLPESAATNLLGEKLNKTFQRDKKVIRSEFESGPLAFQKGVAKMKTTSGDEAFMKWSVESMKRLKDLISSAPLATGGYLVFMEFEVDSIEFAGAYFVRESPVVSFHMEDDTYQIDVEKGIDTSELAMAARVNLKRYRAGNDRYHEFTFSGPKKSDYFAKWVEVSLLDKSTEDSEALVRLINLLPEFPIDPDTGEAFEGDKFRKQVLGNINSVGGTVRLNEISKAYWDDEDYLTDFAQKSDIQISHEFQAVDNIIKQLQKYKVKSRSLELAFAKSDLENGRIVLGDEGDQVIITDSKIRDAVQGFLTE
jgi:nucleoid-associated protein